VSCCFTILPPIGHAIYCIRAVRQLLWTLKGYFHYGFSTAASPP